MSSTLRQELSETLGEVEWSLVKPHLERGAVITVSLKLNLVEVAERVAADDTTQVSEWVQNGLLGKPSLSEIETWDKSPTRKVRSLVVQPYVLIQEIPLN
ncbi:MAG: DUF2288 domain-containing protein [Bdellovibrionota bacterium]